LKFDIIKATSALFIEAGGVTPTVLQQQQQKSSNMKSSNNNNNIRSKRSVNNNNNNNNNNCKISIIGNKRRCGYESRSNTNSKP